MGLFSIEAAVRSAFSWTLVELFGGEKRVALPDWTSRPFRILFVRDDGIGDLMVTMEMLRAIKEISPRITLDLLCSPSNAAFGRSLPFIDEVIVHKRGPLLSAIPTWRALRRRRYDVVIDGRVAIANVNKQTTCLLLATGARWRIGLAGRRNDRVYSVPVYMDRVDHWVDAHVALLQPFGIAANSRDWLPRLSLSSEDRSKAADRWSEGGGGRPRVLVNLYSASADRQWPVEQFEELARALRQRSPEAVIVIPTMPAGDAVSERIATSSGGAAMPLSLSEVTAMTATADLVISPDTAITVIASAFRVPVLALMRKNTQQWVPYKNKGSVVFSDDPRSLRRLPTERVVAELFRLMDQLQLSTEDA